MKQKPSCTSGKQRLPVPVVQSLPKLFADILREQKAAQEMIKTEAGTSYKDYGLVFATKKGTPIEPNSVLRSLKSTLKKHGFPIMSVHDLRHSFATMLLTLGENPKVVAEMMGSFQCIRHH